MISLKTLLKQPAEPVCSLIPNCVAGFNHKLQHQILGSFRKCHPFAVLKLFHMRERESEAPQWESGHCKELVKDLGCPSWQFSFFIWIINPSPLPKKILASHENTALASCGRSSWEIQAVEGQQDLPLGQDGALLSGRDVLFPKECLLFPLSVCVPFQSFLPSLVIS